MKNRTKKQSRFAFNQVELSDALKVTRMTISRWSKVPGSPPRTANGRYDVASWKRWAETEGRKQPITPDMQQAKARTIRLKNERLEIELKALREQYTPIALVRKWGQELSEAVTPIIRSLHTIAPAVVALSTADAEIRLREVEDEILTKLNEIRDKDA